MKHKKTTKNKPRQIITQG